MKKLTNGIDRAKFLGELIIWCIRWGCEVQLRNKLYRKPVTDGSPWAVGEFHERDRDGSLVDLTHHMKIQDAQMPELVFRKDDKYISIVGVSWEELLKRVEYEHKRVYMELSVPMMGDYT